MNNETIRERLKEYVSHCRTPYTAIAAEMGLGAPSRYILSRFLNGRYLNTETLDKIDRYLSDKGY